MSRTIEYRIKVDSTGAIKSMEEVSKETEKTDKKMDDSKKSSDELGNHIKGLGSTFGGLKNMIGMAIGAVGLGGLAFGLKDVVSKTMEVNKEAEHFSSLTGLNTQASLDYTAALKARGVGAETFGKAFKMLAKNIQTAERQQYTYSVGQEKAHMQGKLFTTEIGVQAEALGKLGISIQSFKALSPERQFETITKKLEGMHSGLEKTTLMADLFGRGASSLSSIFQSGGLGLTSFLKAAREYFPIVHGGARGQEELIAQQEKSGLAWEGLEVTLGEKVAPALTHVYGEFSKVIGSIEQGHGAWGTLERDASTVFSDLREVWTWLEHTKAATNLLVPALGFLGAAWAVEKVIGFYDAIKKLTLLQALIGPARGLAVGIGLIAPAETAAATEAPVLAGALTAINPELAALAGAFAIYQVIKDLHGPTHLNKGQVEAIGGRRPYKGRQITGAVGRTGTTAGSQPLLPMDENLGQGAIPGNAGGGVGHAIVVPVHIDGRKVAEAFVKNPNTQRYLGEAAERAALVRTARR